MGGFETISQPEFWAPIYFSPNLRDGVKLQSLWFSLRASRINSFTENFVENFVAIARRFISEHDDHGVVRRDIHRVISQIILKSNQREFFLKLTSDLPDKSLVIPSKSEVEKIKFHKHHGNKRALVKCASCGVSEKSEKHFQKCSRCGFVFYCSKACQRNDWNQHKQICKEIRKQN